MNNQTTAKMKSDSKTVQFEVWFCSKEAATALRICRFIDAQLPPQMMLSNHQQNIFQLHV